MSNSRASLLPDCTSRTRPPVFDLGHGRIGEQIRMRQHVSYSFDTEHEGSVTVAVQCASPAFPNRSSYDGWHPPVRVVISAHRPSIPPPGVGITPRPNR